MSIIYLIRHGQASFGAENYDKLDQSMEIDLKKALKKFVKDWKTLDSTRINFLMQYGLVQEVMKVEERKAIRREIENNPHLQALRAASLKKNANKDIEEV